MNKKITIRNAFGKICYCVVSGERDMEEQLNEVYFGSPHPTGGYRVEYNGEIIRILDVFAYDTVTTFKPLSIEETELEISYNWTVVEEE